MWKLWSFTDLHFVKTVYLLCENYVFSYREQMGWFYAEEIGSVPVYLSERHWDRLLFLVRKFVSKKTRIKEMRKEIRPIFSLM